MDYIRFVEEDRYRSRKAYRHLFGAINEGLENAKLPDTINSETRIIVNFNYDKNFPRSRNYFIILDKRREEEMQNSKRCYVAKALFPTNNAPRKKNRKRKKYE